MPDVGHARADENLVNLVPGHLGEEPRVVRVVGSAQNGFLDLVHVNLNHRRVLGVGVRLQELRVREPSLHAGDAALQRAPVAVALVDHPLEHDDVGLEVLRDGFLIELDGATGGGPLGGGVGELKRLLALEVREPFNLEDAAGEDVLLALLRDGEVPFLDGVVRDGVHQVAERDAGLHGTLETHQDGLGHVQRDHASRRAERDEAGPGGEGDADREARVRVTARADGVGQEHAVEPGVDDAVAGAKAHAAAVPDEVRKGVVGHHVDRFGVRGGVAERLHHEIRREPEAREILELVTGHRAGGILRTHRGHLGLAVRAGENAAVDAARLADHLLREREPLGAPGGVGRQPERVGRGEAQALASAGGEPAADDQVDAPARLNLVEQHVRLEIKLAQLLAGAVPLGDALVRVDLDDVAHVHRRHVHLER